ncbi:MAG: alpha/beta fold hydrolase [Chloroflexota bacterium]
MKRKIRSVKRRDIQIDYDLYRVNVPIPGIADAHLSVLDLHPEGATETILFQHGFAGVLESWEFQINHFARNYRVIAPDLRGHGQSDAPYTQYTMQELVSDLDAIVKYLDLPERFTFVAHSFGGSIAVEYATAYPERIDKLVLVATAGEYPLPKIAHFAFRIPTPILRPLWQFRPRWDAELHVFKRLASNNLLAWKGWDKMRALTAPTLVLTGERDLVFPRFVFDDVGETIPNAEINDIGAAKHKVQLERHNAVNRAIERFVQNKSQQSWRAHVDQSPKLQNRVWLSRYAKETPPSLPIPNRPLTTFLESTADWLPKRTAISFYGTKFTYRQLYQQVNQFAHVLNGLGVRAGDRVMIVLPNMPQFVVAYYGALTVGGVIVLPNPDADAAMITQQVHQTTPKVLITLEEFGELAAAIRAHTSIEHVLLTNLESAVSSQIYQQLMNWWGPARSRGQKTGSQAGTQEESTAVSADSMALDMQTLMADAPVTPFAGPVTSDDLAAVIFTSGTTDAPKGVCLTHENLVANTLQTRHWLPDARYGEETMLTVLPLIHSYGMTNAMNLPIAIGATMVLLPVFELEDVLQHIKQHKVTLFPGVPTMYMAINQARKVRQYGLSSIKACLSGAAPLPIEVQETFEKLTRGFLVEGYGLTEASPVTHANPIELDAKDERKIGSIGIPLPNTDAKIVDMKTGEDLPPGEVGELVIKGPQVMKGYWPLSPEANHETAQTLKDGWLYTGDIAVCDHEGFFQIISRKRDTIIFGEYSVYPRDVEEVIYENNKVMEAAVVGIPSDDDEGEGNQKVKAVVVPRPGVGAGIDLTIEELLELCQRRLEPYAVPWKIEFREQLPKSFVGKVLRRLLVDEPEKNEAGKDEIAKEEG